MKNGKRKGSRLAGSCLAMPSRSEPRHDDRDGLGLDLRRRAVAFGLDALENGRGEVGVRRMRSLEKLSGVAGLLRPTFHVGACESQLVSLDAPRDLSCGWEVVRGAQQGDE